MKQQKSWKILFAGPVSYTHLDVYKRQACHSADESQDIKKLEKALEIYVYAMVNISHYFESK